MKVNPSTRISYDVVTEEVTRYTPNIVEIKRTVRKEEKVYEVELTQEQLDLLVAICGHVVEGGPVRELTDSIFFGLVEYATRDEQNYCEENKFSTYFEDKLSRSGNLIAKEQS